MVVVADAGAVADAGEAAGEAAACRDRQAGPAVGAEAPGRRDDPEAACPGPVVVAEVVGLAVAAPGRKVGPVA